MPSTGEKSVCSYSTLTLPDDWSVVEKQRCSLAASPGRVDKYYYEPGTGKTFRSLISVYKYLREGKTDTPMTKKLRADNKSSMQIIPYTIRSNSSFILPDD
ncbi:methyl-CpG-binding domain-containing protein 6 [Ziziphus jujuba]|uniref:Methyl-CpG-binding domain-containing protein 6 n=1 Tax=Ziziphus jujuba TaxID=326968 RepID=A0ABM3IBJ3_ZIZJJ|nr:methyl-CpG-binding domain-containing protein 6 [Ziziphus jujuba]